jgi:hypothetical protein
MKAATGVVPFSSSVVVDSTGQLTFPVAATLGQIPSGSGVQVAAFTTQTDVKQTWGDGSLRYGIASCNATSTGSKALTVGAASGAAFTPTPPTVTVTFVITAGSGSGSTYVATLGSYTAADKWLSGDHVVEWRKRVTPVKAGPVDHDNLRVLFDVRSYAAGGHRVDVTVENCRDSASMTYATYDAVIAIGGVDVYDTSTADWTAGLKHWSFTAWRKVLTTGLTEATATLDFEPFYDAKLLYKPMAGMQSKDWTADARWGSTDYFGPLRFGMLEPLMGAGGGRPELAPIPMWDAEFLAQQDPNNLTIIKRNAEATAAWTGGRVYSNDGATIYKVDDGTHNLMTCIAQSSGTYPAVFRAPTETSALTGGRQYVGARDDNDPATPTNEVYPRPDNEHPPDCHVPYVVTGDRFFIDQAKHWANLWLFRTALDGGATYESVNTGRDAGSYDGCLASGGFRGTTRGFGRPLRILVSVANLLPDSDGDKSTFVGAVNDNLDFLSGYNTTRTATGDPYHDAALFWEANTNAIFYTYDPLNLSSVTRSVLYTQGFGYGELAHTIWWANATGMFTVPAGALTLCDRLCQWFASAIGSGSDSTMPRDWMLNAYYPPVGERAGISGSSVTLTSGLSDFADRCKNDLTSIFQGSSTKVDLVCNNSTTVSSASTAFLGAAWVGMPVCVGGEEGSNWLEEAYTVGYGQRIATPGLYVVQSVPTNGSLVLDRKPVVDGQNETDGFLQTLLYPSAVLDYNGATTMLALKVAAARGLTSSTDALTYANAYSSGGFTIEDVLLGTNGQETKGYVGYGLDLT